MIAAIIRWLPLSLALHSAVLATTLLLPRESVLPPLFVDLTLTETSADRDGAARGARAVATAPMPPRAAAAARPRGSTLAARSTPAPPASTPQPPASTPAPPPTPALPPPATAAPAPPAPTAAAPVATPPSPSGGPTTSGTGAASSDVTSAASEGASSGSGAAVIESSGATSSSAPDAQGSAAGSGGGITADGGDALALAISGDDGGVYAGYVALLRRRVQEALTYPSAARRRGMSGTVHLDIAVEPTGRIADVLVVRSSSHDLLDAAALDAVRALRRVPFPPGVRPRSVRVRLPVVFELR